MSIAVIPSLLVLLILPLLFGSFASGEPFSCDPGDAATASFPFCRTSLSILERVKDLIDRLTLEEKVKLLVNNATAVPRLGIKEYDWWSEALHGVSDSGSGVKFGGDFPGATIFPQVITTAASFNVSLWEAIGRVVSDEARAMYNGGVAGLTYWSPNVNIFRDPRWGRGQETPGEDPLVVSKYATSYVRGLQGNDNGRLKVAACCKHFTAYDVDNWNGVEAYSFNAKVSKQDMEDTFNVPFKACVMEGKVASVMCSYNQVNGVPTCADPNLLRETVRAEWGLNGYIVSDCDAVPNFYKTQNFTSNPEEAAIAAIKAGLDLECGPLLAIHTQNAVNKNLLSEAEVNDALANTLAVQMRLGMFDGEPSALPYGKLGPRDVCSPASQQLALESARQGIVLLKNHDHSLLLSQNLHRVVAVIGPNANVTETMIGNYAGVPCQYTTPLQGIGNYAKTLYQSGCTNVACTDSELFGDAIDAARLADATVLIMGLDQSIETEGRDRTELLLPGHQHDLVSDVAMASKGPTILILMSGGPIDVSFAQNNPRISAIIWVGYPGQAGGAAIADILFGAANPEGKLPMTWYPQEYVSKLPMTEMSMRPSSTKGYPGRTYRFYNGPVVYPFGYGLSYTNFFLSIASAPNIFMVPFDDHLVYDKSIKVSRARCDRLIVSLEVDVKNTGSRDGTHTLLVFHEPPFGDEAPHKQLVAFEKMQITAGTQRRIGIDINVCKYLSIVNSFGVRRIPLGQHKIHVGDIQHTISLQTVGAETASLYTGLSRFLVVLFPFVLVMVWLQRRKCLTFVKNRRWRKEDKSAIKDDEISLVIR